MICLKGYIGFLGSGAETESGRTILSLPGMSLESIDKVAKAEQVTYNGVFEDVETRALKKFESNLTSQFSKRYRRRSVKSSISLGKIIDLVNTQSATLDQYRGFAVESNLLSDRPFTVSNLQGLSWQSLSLYLKAKTTSPVTLNIWNLDTKEVLWTKSLAVSDQIIGWNDIKVNEVFFNSSRFFAGFEGKEISSPLLTMNSNYLSSSYSGYASLQWGCSCESFIRGAVTGTKSDPTTLSYGDNSFGLSGTFSAVCSFEPLVCNNKKSFEEAWLYQLGEEMMVERLYSPRWSWWSLTGDEAKEMMNYFKGIRTREIEKAIDGIDLDLRDGCLECNQQVRVMEATP